MMFMKNIKQEKVENKFFKRMNDDVQRRHQKIKGLKKVRIKGSIAESGANRYGGLSSEQTSTFGGFMRKNSNKMGSSRGFNYGFDKQVNIEIRSGRNKKTPSIVSEEFDDQSFFDLKRDPSDSMGPPQKRPSAVSGNLFLRPNLRKDLSKP